MRVLVACEFSGTVRNAFEQRGHSAWSCDLLPSEKPGLHYEGDVFDLLDGWVPVRWTMDCVIEDGSIDVCKSSGNYLCDCPCYGPTQDGLEYKETATGLFARPIDKPHWDLMIAHPPCTYLASSGLHWNKRRPERAAQTEQALAFVMALANAPIPRIAIENPIGALSSRWRKPDQIIQPWMFGEDASKATCLWLKGLDPLRPTNILPGGSKARRGNQTPSGQNKLGPSPNRWKERSRTFQGIADAMANQWG
jgi:hypothetical protein